MIKKATFRFYEELNDFLPPEKKKTSFDYGFKGKPSIKDAIESVGVPHTEVDLILVNGNSVTFFYHLQDGDRVSVYPVFESLDISSVTHLRAKPLREPKFILDVHLGKLTKYLRMLGFDTLYKNNYHDSEIVTIARIEKRTILSRDIELFKIGVITHGYWIRSTQPEEQLKEVICRFDLFSAIKPFYRCIACNGSIQEIPKASVLDKLKPRTRLYYDDFFQCMTCEKIYWKGSHYHDMKKFIGNLKKFISSQDEEDLL